MKLIEKTTNSEYLAISGSKLYGCNQTDSDTDTRGFMIPSKEVLLGRRSLDQIEDRENDSVVYSITKFFSLLEKGSPNIIELLFVPESHILHLTDTGVLFLKHKHLFLDKHTIKPMMTFAKSQILKAKAGGTSKDLYHAFRLAEQAYELAKNGEIVFPRPNADFFIKIRNGDIPVEVIEPCVDTFEKLTQSILASDLCPLPDEKNRERIDDLFFKCVSPKLDFRN